MNDPLDRAQVRRQFDRAASTYDDVAALQRSTADLLIDAMVADPAMSDIGHMVDLGCGTGYALARLADRWPVPLTGVDLSHAMLARASAAVPEGNFIHADLHALPFADASLDCLFSNAAIQWCDLDRVTAEFRRVLAVDGKFFVATFLDNTLHQFTTAFQSVGLADPVHAMHTRSEVEAAFGQSGLAISTAHQQTHELAYADVDAMFAAVRKLGARNARQSRSRSPMSRQQYRRLRDVLDARRRADGSLTLTFETLLVIGERRP